MKMLMTFKKYYLMIFYVCLGVGIYLLLKKNPSQAKKMLLYANNVVKFMPINKTSMDLLNPILDFTTAKESFADDPQIPNLNNNNNNNNTNHSNPTKRCVSETKKKYVAANQNWECGHCKTQLDHTYEIDHRVRLEYGGGNDVQNLVALCRNCHGKKTAEENM